MPLLFVLLNLERVEKKAKNYLNTQGGKDLFRKIKNRSHSF